MRQEAFVLLLCCLIETGSATLDIRIGAVFENEGANESRALRVAVDAVNSGEWTLPRSRLIYLSRNITRRDSLSALTNACDLTKIGVTSIVTTVSCSAAWTVQSLTENLHIPLLQIGGVRCKQQAGSFTFSPKPDTNAVLNTLNKYLTEQRIFNTIIICEEDAETAMAERLAYKLSQGKLYTGVPTKFLIRIAAPTISKSWDAQIDSASHHVNHILVNTRYFTVDAAIVIARPRNAIALIRKLEKLSRRPERYIRWIILNLSTTSKHLRNLELSSSPITVIKMFYNTSRPTVQRFVRAWNNDVRSTCRNCPTVQADEIPLSAYYLHDGILHLSTALTRAIVDRTYISSTPLTCSSKTRLFWPGGESIMKIMHKLNTSGVLSGLSLTESGYNKLSTFEVVHKPVGRNKPFRFERTITLLNANGKSRDDHSLPVGNITLKIATLEEHPFVIISRNEGRPHFHGFAIDLLDALADRVGFQYELYEVQDKHYGHILPNGTWTGLIGDVMQGKADMSVAAMTITADREVVVDFARRYMDYSVGIVIKKPHAAISLFSFVEPFHYSVWFCIISSLVLVVVFIYILTLVSPNRREVLNNDGKTETFNLRSVFWFAYSSLMQQGGDLNKVTLPARVVVGFWWLFTLFVISSYTANLAAFLTVKRLDSPIRSIRDLAFQKDYSYGTVKDTSIFNFIINRGEETTDATSLYKRMSQVVKKRSNVINDAAHGFERAANGHFAFLWDVAVIEYEVINHKTCGITTIRDSIYDKGYGFALPHGSPYRDPVSLEIMDLQDKGWIEKLKNKWWPKSGKCKLEKDAQNSEGAELTLNNFTGIFFVLATGLVLGILLAVVEICVHLGKGKSYPPNVTKMDEHRRTKSNGKDIHLILSKKELLIQLLDSIVHEATQINPSVESFQEPDELLENNVSQISGLMHRNNRTESKNTPRTFEIASSKEKMAKMKLGSAPSNYTKLVSSPCKPLVAEQDGTTGMFTSSANCSSPVAFDNATKKETSVGCHIQTFPRSTRNRILEKCVPNMTVDTACTNDGLNATQVHSLLKKSSV